MITPPALRPGDCVGIVAPASVVEPEALSAGCDALQALGYRPVYEESILAAEFYFAGSTERRARELEGMFARPEVRAIVCARGGYGCNHLLPYLDLDIVRRNPKIFVGYSDVTTLLTWFHDATGLVTFHGPMVAKDFAQVRGVDLASWQAGVAGLGELHRGIPLTPVIPGKAVGKLYGGCLSMLTASLGTPYSVQTEGAILLIEDISTHPYQIDRMLMQLKLAGKLAGVRGVVFGVMRHCAPPPNSSYTLIDVIRRCLEDLNIPVAFGLNSGHVEQGNLTVALGVTASLVVEEARAELTTLESSVCVAG